MLIIRWSPDTSPFSLISGLNAWTVLFYCALGVSSVALKSHTWGTYPLACLLLPCVIFHCSPSTFWSIPVSRTLWILLEDIYSDGLLCPV